MQRTIKASGRDLVQKISYRLVFTEPGHIGAGLLALIFSLAPPLGLRFFNRSTVKIKDDEHFRSDVKHRLPDAPPCIHDLA